MIFHVRKITNRKKKTKVLTSFLEGWIVSFEAKKNWNLYDTYSQFSRSIPRYLLNKLSDPGEIFKREKGFVTRPNSTIDRMRLEGQQTIPRVLEKPLNVFHDFPFRKEKRKKHQERNILDAHNPRYSVYSMHEQFQRNVVNFSILSIHVNAIKILRGEAWKINIKEAVTPNRLAFENVVYASRVASYIYSHARLINNEMPRRKFLRRRLFLRVVVHEYFLFHVDPLKVFV